MFHLSFVFWRGFFQLYHEWCDHETNSTLKDPSCWFSHQLTNLIYVFIAYIVQFGSFLVVSSALKQNEKLFLKNCQNCVHKVFISPIQTIFCERQSFSANHSAVWENIIKWIKIDKKPRKLLFPTSPRINNNWKLLL